MTTTPAKVPTPPRTSAVYNSAPLGRIPKTDELDRVRVASRIAEVLQDLSDTSESTVVAVTAPWGAGKSTVIRDVRERLHGWTIRWFDAWLVDEASMLAESILAEIFTAAPPETLAEMAGKARRKAYQRAKPALEVSKGNLGVTLELLAGQDAQTQHAKLGTQLSKLKRPILIVVDDADRLQPNELVELFRVIRAVGNLPKVCYLLAYDEETVLRLLCQSTVTTDTHEARAFLEKIVQLRFDLPTLLSDQVKTLFDNALRSFMQKHGESLTSEQQSRLDIAWDVALCELVTTPRSVNLMFAQLEATWPLVRNEVDLVDFLCLTCIRLTEPTVYARLRRDRHLLTQGMTARAVLLHGATDARQFETMAVEKVQKALGESTPEHRQATSFLTSSLFPRPPRALTGRLRIGDPAYVDRYFYVGVPKSDVPDSAVRAAVESIRSGHRTPDENVVVERLTSQREVDLILAKMQTWATGLTANEARAIVRWLLSPPVAERLVLHRSINVWGWLANLFALIHPDAAEIGQLSIVGLDSLTLLLDVVENFPDVVAPETLRAATWYGALAGRVDDEVERNVRELFRSPPEEQERWSMGGALRRTAKRYPRGLRTVAEWLPSAGGWDLLDIAATFVTLSSSDSVTWHATELRHEEFLQAIGRDLAAEVMRLVEMEPTGTSTTSSQHANRRLIAANKLRDLGTDRALALASIDDSDPDLVPPQG